MLGHGYFSAEELRVIGSTFPQKEISKEDLQIIENLRLEDKADNQMEEALLLVQWLGPEILAFAKELKKSKLDYESHFRNPYKNPSISSLQRELEDEYENVSLALESYILYTKDGLEAPNAKKHLISCLIDLGLAAAMLAKLLKEGC